MTRHNFRECIALKVRDDGKHVAPNVYAIVQSKVEPEKIALAIYSDETVVGFMYEIDHASRKSWLARFMIDQRCQHKGYGRGGLARLKEMAMGEMGDEEDVNVLNLAR